MRIKSHDKNNGPKIKDRHLARPGDVTVMYTRNVQKAILFSRFPPSLRGKPPQARRV